MLIIKSIFFQKDLGNTTQKIDADKMEVPDRRQHACINVHGTSMFRGSILLDTGFWGKQLGKAVAFVSCL